MEITNFRNLLKVVNAIGAEKSIRELIRSIQSGRADANPKNMIHTPGGIYLIDKRGVLARIILYIVDKNVYSRYFPLECQEYVNQKRFDEPELIKEIHRYHLVNCSTLKQAESEGWKGKYKMSQRVDGNFYYRFVYQEDLIVVSQDQKLEICSFCLKEINSSLEEKDYTKQNFHPNIFFPKERKANISIDFGTNYAICSVPNIYAADWKSISTNYKKLVNYQCEGFYCVHTDLSSKKLKKFLHTHHVDFHKNNNYISNLKALCIRCHAEEPGHSHLKNAPDYKKYCDLIGNSIN